jgi:hypothetical protein
VSAVKYLEGVLKGCGGNDALTLTKALLKDSLRKRLVPRSLLQSASGIFCCWDENRPATAELARRVWPVTGTSTSCSSSNTGGGPNFRLNGKDAAAGVLVGDWARKYDKMGEVAGEGSETRWFVVGVMGVRISDWELNEPDDEDETEADRRRKLVGLMVIGAECLMDVSLLLEAFPKDIVEKVWLEVMVRVEVGVGWRNGDGLGKNSRRSGDPFI